jgi:hypothetical protein
VPKTAVARLLKENGLKSRRRLTAEDGYRKVGSPERQYLHEPEEQRMGVPISGKNEDWMLPCQTKVQELIRVNILTINIFRSCKGNDPKDTDQ